jgi:acyl carrier protein
MRRLASSMDELVEPRARHLVAEQLGVRLEDLVAEVSLREDLAADSLDLVELSIALEGEFAIVVPARLLEEIRTYGDVIRATGVLIRARWDEEAREAEAQAKVAMQHAGDSAGCPVG